MSVTMDTDYKFFVVTRHLIIDNVSLPKSFRNNLYIVEFSNGNLEDPKSEPIGVYYKWGTRVFVWRDALFGEYNLDADRLISRMKISGPAPYLDRLCDMLRRYSRDSFNINDSISRPENRNLEFGSAKDSVVRVLYKLKNQEI